MTQLFTDTSANLPIGLALQHKIKILPFSYTVNGVEQPYDPTVEFNGPAYYNAIAAGAEVKTSMINITAFYNAFRPVLAAGHNVLYLGMSGGISGTAGAAAAAAAELQAEFPNQKIKVVDTLAASLGEGLLVLRAARLLEKGKPFEAVLADALMQRKTLCQYFVVDSLDHLHRGGRVSKAAAVFGSVLHIKPLLTGDAQGKIVLNAKVRGRRQALAELANRYGELTANPAATVGIAHANNPEGAAALEKLLREKGFAGQCLTVCYEPVTGAHVGPGTVALFFAGVHK